MSDATRLDEIIAGSLARLRAWQATPDGRAHLEHAERLATERRARDLGELAELRGLPADAGVRDVAMRADLGGRFVEAVRQAYAWRAARARGSHGRVPLALWLCSPPGLGKTVAASWAVMHAERSAWYTTAAEVAATVRNGHSEPEAKWRRWERCELLAVDEAGLEPQAHAEVITQLVLARWTHGGVTLIATNLHPRDLEPRYLAGPNGERLADRLINTQARRGQPWWVSAKGPSLRARAGGGR